MKTIWLLIFALCLAPIAVYYGCDTPYSGHLGPEAFNGWIESEENGFVCLWNGFDRLCIQTVQGPPGKDGRDGKDGKDGKDGQTLIAVREVPVETVIEKIIETVVIEEIVKEVPVEIVVERVVTEYVDREVPIEIFVTEIVEVIKEVIVEKEVIIEIIKEVPVYQPFCVILEKPTGQTIDLGDGNGPVELIALEKICFLGDAGIPRIRIDNQIIEVPVETYVEVIKEVPVEVIKEVIIEVPVEVIKEVPVEKIVEVIKTVYVNETPPISVTEGATYTESGYHNPPDGFHAHQFSHTHDGATHTHRVIHPDGEKDDWDREHDGFSGLAHD